MVRTPCDKSGMRKGTWTPEEDKKLTAYVTKYGCWNWRQLPRFAGLSRCGKSCRLRWMNYLRPNLKRGNYTKEEDELIIKLHESLGNRWSTIASHLPGRTDNEIKNHWHTALSKKGSKQELQSSSTSSNYDDDDAGKSLKRKSKSQSKQLQRNRKRRISSSSSLTETAVVDGGVIIFPGVQEILESSEFSLQQQPSISGISESLIIQPATSSGDESSSSQPSVSEESDNFDGQQIINAECSSGSFWTEPFLTDNLCYYNNYPTSSPFSTDEFLCSYEFYDEHFMIW